MHCWHGCACNVWNCFNIIMSHNQNQNQNQILSWDAGFEMLGRLSGAPCVLHFNVRGFGVRAFQGPLASFMGAPNVS